MSFQAMTWAVKQPLQCHEKIVLLMLANYADEKGKCFPSMKRLALECGLSLSQTRKSMAKLEEWKLVRRYGRIRSYGQTSNTFVLNLTRQTPTPIERPPTPIECHNQSH